MAEETTGLELTEGQSTEGSETTTQGEPGGEGEQSGLNQEGATQEGHQNETVVYDPAEFERLSKDLSPEMLSQVQALQNGLQGSYTKKFQNISDSRKKIEAYDAFNSDPMGQLEILAKQAGYTLSKPGANNQPGEGGGEFDPQSWDDVFKKVETSMMEKLAPMFNEVQNIKKGSIETQLSEIDPTWKQYEGDMMSNLKTHPTLSADPALLYRMSVPANVLESRATQQALKKMQEKVNSGKISGNSTTTKTKTSGLPDKAMTFDEAVTAAKKKLANDGVHNK